MNIQIYEIGFIILIYNYILIELNLMNKANFYSLTAMAGPLLASAQSCTGDGVASSMVINEYAQGYDF
jgi:hypothetical protein